MDASVKARLSVRGLRVSRGRQDVLRGVDLEVVPGEICALMGISGAGKSTVLRAITALQPFTAGSVVVDGFSLTPGALPPESRLAPLRRSVGMVFQAHSLFEHLTALENVVLAPIYVYGSTRQEAHEVAHKLLASLGVASRAEAFPRELSGGEAQRMAIARALAPGPTTLLMDEPTSGLDPARRAALGQTLRELAAEGKGILFATHDVEFARAHADRVVILAEGIVVEQGPAASVLDRPTHEATRQLLRSPEPTMANAPKPTRRPELHGKEHL